MLRNVIFLALVELSTFIAHAKTRINSCKISD